MGPLRQTVLALSLSVLAGCTSTEDNRRTVNQDQIALAQQLLARQQRIESFAASLPPIRAASAEIRSDRVILEILPEPGAKIDPATQARLNAFITDETGVPRDRISLLIPRRAIPDRPDAG